MCPLRDFGYECVSFRHDVENCGACGNACEDDEGVKGAVCRKGKCEVCESFSVRFESGCG